MAWGILRETVATPRPLITATADGTITIDDWPPELWRQACARWPVVAICGAAAGFALWCALLAHADMEAGIRYSTNFRFQPIGVLIAAAALALGFAAAALTLLYLKLRLLRRLRNPAAALVVSVAGLTDRWAGGGVIPWSRIARARLGATDGGGALIRLDMVAGDTIDLSARYGLATLPQAMDTLYAMACHIPVEGLTGDYRPSHTALQELVVPSAHLVPLPASEDGPVDHGDISVRTKPWSPWRLLIGALFCVACVLYIAGKWDGPSVVPRWFAVLILAIFGSGLFLALRERYGSPQGFQADPGGVRFDDLSALGSIPWCAIAGIDGWLAGPGGCVAFVVPDLAARLGSLPPHLRQSYCRRYGNDGVILRRMSKSGGNPARLAAQMRRWRHESLSCR